MKIGKIIIPALLALGAIGGFATAKAAEKQHEAKVSLATTEHDLDIDVGINVQPDAEGKEATGHTIGQFYVNTFESGDVSNGDYLAFRMRSVSGGASYFDFIPNVGGNAKRVPISPAASGIKCIPAVNDGVAFDYGGARTWDLPMNFWADADVWFCIPKTTFTRTYFGGDIDWNDGLWAVYFMFYSTKEDVVNFDVGDLWTANIDGAGHLVKVNRIINWASIDGSGVNGLDALEVTRKNPTLRPAVNMARAIMDVDACDASSMTTAYNTWKATHAAFDEDTLTYFNGISFYDYANGDTAHANGKTALRNMGVKWAAIVEQVGGGSPSRVIYKENDNELWVLALVSGTAVMIFAALLIMRKKRIAQK